MECANYKERKRELLLDIFLRFTLIGFIICILIFPAFNLIPRYCNVYQDPCIGVLLHKCNIRAFSLQALVIQDVDLPHELHLLMPAHWLWWLLVSLLWALETIPSEYSLIYFERYFVIVQSVPLLCHLSWVMTVTMCCTIRQLFYTI